jgi:hypothetical protein
VLSLTLTEAVAGAVRVTVHVPVELDASVVGVHCSEAITRTVDRLRLTVLEPPLKAAVNVPFWLVLNAPVLTVKVPVVVPGAIVIEAGTVKAGSPLLLTVTVTVPCSALDTVTIHVAVEFGPSVVGVHWRDEIAGVSAKLRLTLCDVLL